MTKGDIDQINDWLQNPENKDKLTQLELAKINLYFQEYMEKIAPVVICAMNRDNKTTFLFKL